MLSTSILAGPVASAATAAWYQHRAAALASITAADTAAPGFTLLNPNGAPSQTSTPSSDGLTPAQLDTYYGFAGLKFGSTTANGAGQTIALVDAYNDPDITADLSTFDKAYGLAAPASFKVVSQTGSTTALPKSDTPNPVSGSWASEESLDVEWAHALAPGASILLVEADSADDSDLFTAAAYAASAPGVSVVSMSFGESESYLAQSDVASIDPTFATPSGHTGVTFLASSGDQGAYADNGPLDVEYPASSPDVLAVGGTTLGENSSGNPDSETAWSGSGGGVSVLEAQSSSQKATVGTFSGREVPDVSFDADPNSGVNVCDSFDFGSSTPFEVFGGTSFSSPAWGAIIAITNQGRVIAGHTALDGRSQTIPDLYSDDINGSYSSVFRDITSGSNGYYSASKGYDETTGLGSPVVSKLVPQLAAITTTGTAPVIGAFTINPAVENAGTSITLTASNLSDAVGTVASVSFYRKSGSTSTLLGTGKNSSGVWTLSISTTGLAAGTYTYTAPATNNYKQTSAAVSTTNKVVTGQTAPTISTFTVSPGSETAGTNITLTATGVADTTSSISSVKFYLETGNTLSLLGSGANQGSGKWTFVAGTATFTPGTYTFAVIATAASGLVSTTHTATNKVTAPANVTYTVNTLKDQTDAKGSSTVSLRDAITLADAAVGPVTINFSSSVFASLQTIVLAGSTLSITNAKAAVTITGPGAGVAISGNNAREVLSISAGAVVSLSNLTIEKGASAENGGGITNAGKATLTNVIVTANAASGLYGQGGGIENDGTLSLVNSTITGNTAANGSGGGINNTGVLSAATSTISKNSASYDGAGIDNTGTITLTSSTVSGNTAGLDGGGVFNYGTATFNSSTISGNTADFDAGALYSGNGYGHASVVTMTNCTVADNISEGSYAGIENAAQSKLTISDSTVSLNKGESYSGIGNAGTVTIANTIVAGNIATDTSYGGVDVEGAFSSRGHNLIGQTDSDSSGWQSSDDKGTAASPLSPLLSPLGSFGGPTQTMIPLPGSKALGGGSTSLVPTGVTKDQRGEARTVSGKVDIGSVETQPSSPLKLTAPASQTASAGKAASIALGSLADSSTKGPFTVIVNWGDGSTNTVFTQSSTGTLTAQPHAFAKAATFTASVVVLDPSGNVSNQSTFTIKVGAAGAVVYTVNTTKDQTDAISSSTVSLRDAINRADALLGPVTIEFDSSVFASHQTITLSGSDLSITNTAGLVQIIGPKAGVSISGNGKVDVLRIAANSSVSLSNLAIIDGNGDNGSGDALSGGITNAGTLIVVDSTISGNQTIYGGGGLYNTGTLTMINSTLANNTSQYSEGGGLYTSGKATLDDDTIAGNTAYYGGGVYVGPSGSVTIANTIIASNSLKSSTGKGPDVSGAVTSKGHNLIGKTDGSSGWQSSDYKGTDASPLNAHLSALGNNGGPTQTLIPETGSAALGNGSVSLIPTGITTDQRGDARTLSGKVDIGAVEV